MCHEISRLIKLNLVKLYPDTCQSDEDIPTDINEVNDFYKVEARYVATMSVSDDLSRICVIKALESEESIDTAKLHEAFRATTNSQ